MTTYEEIWDFAEDHHGLITTAQAVAMGIDKHYLPAMAQRGTLIKKGHGVYVVKHHIPKENDVYAHSVALAGPSAYLRSASVIALLGLAATSPDVIYVGATARVRRKIPSSVRVTDQCACACVDYEGVRCQPIAEALSSALHEGALDGDRVAEAARNAVRRGLISKAAMKKLTEGVS